MVHDRGVRLVGGHRAATERGGNRLLDHLEPPTIREVAIPALAPAAPALVDVEDPPLRLRFDPQAEVRAHGQKEREVPQTHGGIERKVRRHRDAPPSPLRGIEHRVFERSQPEAPVDLSESIGNQIAPQIVRGPEDPLALMPDAEGRLGIGALERTSHSIGDGIVGRAADVLDLSEVGQPETGAERQFDDPLRADELAMGLVTERFEHVLLLERNPPQISVARRAPRVLNLRERLPSRVRTRLERCGEALLAGEAQRLEFLRREGRGAHARSPAGTRRPTTS